MAKKPTLKESLILEAERFCSDRGITKSRLGKIVVNDGKFFARIEDGGRVTTDTLEKFQAYFLENAPPRNAA